LSGRGLCDELITRPEESYRLCCVVVCDLETSRMGAPYTYDISRLRVNKLYIPRTSCLLEYAVEHRPSLNLSSNPAPTPGTISTIRPLRDAKVYLQLDVLYLREQGCKDPWLFFEA